MHALHGDLARVHIAGLLAEADKQRLVREARGRHPSTGRRGGRQHRNPVVSPVRPGPPALDA